jgi:hypothetical protein
LDLGYFRFRLTEKLPDFWRFTVNEFGSQFDGATTTWIEAGEHATADAITSFEDVHSNAGASQLACRGQPRHAGTNHDYGRIGGHQNRLKATPVPQVNDTFFFMRPSF